MAWSLIPVVAGGPPLATEYNQVVDALNEKSAPLGLGSLSYVTAGVTALLAAGINTLRTRAEALITTAGPPRFVKQGTITATGASNWTLAELLGAGRTTWMNLPAWDGGPVEGATIPANTYRPYIEHLNEIRSVLDQLTWLELTTAVSTGVVQGVTTGALGVWATVWAACKALFPSTASWTTTGMAGIRRHYAVLESAGMACRRQRWRATKSTLATVSDMTVSIPPILTTTEGDDANAFGGASKWSFVDYVGTEVASYTTEQAARNLLAGLAAQFTNGDADYLYMYMWGDETNLDDYEPADPGAGGGGSYNEGARGFQVSIATADKIKAYVLPNWTYTA